MARDDDTIGGEIKAPVALMVRRVADESTQGGAWGKLVRSGSSEVGIAGTSENSEVMVGRKSAVKGKERSAQVQSFGGEAIDEEGGCGKSISPI